MNYDTLEPESLRRREKYYDREREADGDAFLSRSDYESPYEAGEEPFPLNDEFIERMHAEDEAEYARRDAADSMFPLPAPAQRAPIEAEEFQEPIGSGVITRPVQKQANDNTALTGDTSSEEQQLDEYQSYLDQKSSNETKRLADKDAAIKIEGYLAIRDGAKHTQYYDSVLDEDVLKLENGTLLTESEIIEIERLLGISKAQIIETQGGKKTNRGGKGGGAISRGTTRPASPINNLFPKAHRRWVRKEWSKANRKSLEQQRESTRKIREDLDRRTDDKPENVLTRPAAGIAEAIEDFNKQAESYRDLQEEMRINLVADSIIHGGLFEGAAYIARRLAFLDTLIARIESSVATDPRNRQAIIEKEIYIQAHGPLLAETTSVAGYTLNPYEELYIRAALEANQAEAYEKLLQNRQT